jgi:hypothetical protein
MRVATALAAAGLVAAVIAAAGLVFIDTYSGETCFVEPGAPARCVSESSTLIEENGSWVIGLLTVPIMLAAGILAATLLLLPKAVAWILAAVFLLGCLITGFSIGVFFLPAALLSLTAVILGKPRTDTGAAL